MKNLQFYRVQSSNSTNPFLINSQASLSQLYSQIRQKLPHIHPAFTIYYHFKPYPEEEHGIKKLKDIVLAEKMDLPVFVVYQCVEDGDGEGVVGKYGQGLVEAQRTSEQAKEYSIGENGLVLFDNRQTSILASSVNHATLTEQYDITRKEVVRSFNQSIINNDKHQQNSEQGLIRKMLTKLGIIKKDPSSKNLLNTIQTLKTIKTKQDLLEHIDRQYSDYDPKFAAYLESIYLKYAILNGYRMHYIEYKSMQDGVVKWKFGPWARIAVIGDFGTGLADSFGLLRHAIIEKEVDVILHLGDVYYAGTPNEYRKHIMEPLNELRKQAGLKFKKNVLFYSIPGNHDYYTWGLPFLSFVANANQVREITQEFMKKDKGEDVMVEEGQENRTKQEASYFCLQSQDSKWQFIGLDTAYHDSNPMNQINGLSLGPRLRQKQVQWFRDKMQHFPGSTILLTHHQLFSIHDRICGAMSQYKAFTCINPLLSAQLFPYLPAISCWYWGHEHSLMFFEEEVLGVRKCRLLGNSSFHVFQKQGPYLRKKGFPLIPLIEEDEKYMHKYLPLNPEPDEKNPDCYYNLSYALIDFGKQKPLQSGLGQFASTLTVDYYVCPCYPQEQAKKKHFTPYLLFQEQIQPRADTNLITSQKLLKNQHDVVGNIHEITQDTELYVKTQIGLYVDTGVKLTLCGVRYRVRVEKSVDVQLAEKGGSGYRVEESGEAGEKKVEEKQEKEKKPSKLLLDGDIISFRQVKQMMKKPSSQQQKMTLSKPSSSSSHPPQQPSPEQFQTLLDKHPILQPITSLQSSTDSLPQPAQQLVQQTVINFLQDILEEKKFEIRKFRVLKDVSLHVKFGDAFTLRDLATGQYLAVHIGVYGGILKLAPLKANQQPCLFMFTRDSKVKLAK